MDKEEYRQKLEELNGYVRDKDYEDALAVVEQVDWRRVKSINTLNMVADVYEVNKEYKKAKMILEYAYNRASIGRSILYRLVDISLKIGDTDDAEKYFQEFSKAARNDNSRCILQYKLYKAKKAPLEAQIDVLEEYRDREYTEQWAYELAKLYSKAGDSRKCVDACDDLILWFSEGQYVLKALELKKKYENLSPSQEATYNRLRVAYRKPRAELVTDLGAAEAAGYEEEAHSQVEAEVAARADLFAARMAKEAEARAAAEAAAQAAAEAENLSAIAVDEPEAEDTEEEAKEEDAETEVEEKEAAPRTGGFRERFTKGVLSALGMEDDEDDEDEEFFAGPASVNAEAKAPEEEEILPEISLPREIENEIFESKEEPAAEDVPEDLPEEEIPEVKEPVFRTVAPAASGFREESPEESEAPAAKKASEPGEFDLEAFLAETAGSFSNEISDDNYRKAAPEENTGLADFDQIDLAAAVSKAAEIQTERKGVISSSAVAAIAGLSNAQKAPEGVRPVRAAVQEAPRKPKYNEELEIPDPEPTAQERRTHTIPLGTIGQNTVPISIDKILSQETPEERRIRILNKAKPSMMNEDQRQIFTYFARIPGMDVQILEAIHEVYQHAGEKTSLHGNIAVMGARGTGKSRLSQGLVVAMCKDLGMDAAKIARVNGDELNRKDPVHVVARMSGGFLLIEDASRMTPDTVDRLNQAMEYRTDCMIVIIEDEKSNMRAFLKTYPQFANKFDKVISIPVFTNDELVSFARIYAAEMGCKIDDLAILALYTMIGNIQTDDVPVTISVVKEMIDGAINRSTRGRRRKRTAEPGAKEIILHEKDFTQN